MCNVVELHHYSYALLAQCRIGLRNASSCVYSLFVFLHSCCLLGSSEASTLPDSRAKSQMRFKNVLKAMQLQPISQRASMHVGNGVALLHRLLTCRRMQCCTHKHICQTYTQANASMYDTCLLHVYVA